MKTYKPTFTNRRGKTRKCARWHLTFVDNRQIRRRLPAYGDKAATDRLGIQIQKLLDANGILDADLLKWFAGLVPVIRDKLIEFGLIDSRRMMKHLDKTLSEHLQDFGAALLAKGNTGNYARQIVSRVGFVFAECRFKTWTDIDANAVYTFLADLRSDEGIGQRSFNYYLKAVKQFCKWMIREQRAGAPSPLEHLSCIKQTEKRRQRRALSLDEQRSLLEVTATQKPHHNMSGPERAFVYRVALESGLRANEIRHLTKASFDFHDGTVTVKAGYAKNKKQAVLNLKRSTTAELAMFLANKLPDMKAFAMPDQPSKMIEKDLAAAGIPYETDEGMADFHSLRHSFITGLARSGVHPSDAQALARHSTITLTMDHYTHVKRESLCKIIENQPDLTMGSDIRGLSVA